MARPPEHPNELPGPPLLDVCVHGQPVSWRSKRTSVRDAWKEQVRRECTAAWPAGLPPIDGRVRIRVTHYYEVRIGDMDNIGKLIQDVLQGIAYRNDNQVDDGTYRRLEVKSVDLEGPYVADYKPPLSEALKAGRSFIHIEVWADPIQEAAG
jgi:hypothetical protein